MAGSQNISFCEFEANRNSKHVGTANVFVSWGLDSPVEALFDALDTWVFDQSWEVYMKAKVNAYVSEKKFKRLNSGKMVCEKAISKINAKGKTRVIKKKVAFKKRYYGDIDFHEKHKAKFFFWICDFSSKYFALV